MEERKIINFPVSNEGAVHKENKKLQELPLRNPFEDTGQHPPSYSTISIEQLKVVLSELFSGQREASSGSNDGSVPQMQDVYKHLIDRLDQDIRDHKQEIRDRDARLQSEMQEREKRIDAKISQTLDTITTLIKETEARNESRIQNIENKLENTYRWIVGIAITTIVGVAAMVITAVL